MERVEVMPASVWSSDLMLPASESFDILCSDLMLPEPKSVEMKPAGMWRHRRMLPEGGSPLVLPKRGVESSCAKGERRTKQRPRGSKKAVEHIRFMVKNLELDEAKKKMMMEEDKTRKENDPKPDDDESIFSVADDGLKEEKPKKKKRTKKVTMRVGEEHIRYMKEHPPPPPYEPVDTGYWLFTEVQDMAVALAKAAREKHDRILEQYKDKGFAEMEFEVTDDDDDESEVANKDKKGFPEEEYCSTQQP